MRSQILRTATLYLLPLMLLFSLFLLHRGHNEPGGGFVGGLVAAAAFSLYTLAFGPHEARRALRVPPGALIALGLLIAVLSGTPALVLGRPFMEGLWFPWSIPGVGKVGTPLAFDVGVFLVVWGVTLTFVYGLAEDSQQPHAAPEE